MFTKNSLKSLWLAALLLAGAGTAQAEMHALPYSDSVLVYGTQLAVIDLSVGLAGTYRVTTADLKWFDTPLQALSFGTFTSTGPIATLQGAGTLEFFSQPGDVTLQIYAKAGGTRNTGLVGFDVTPTAVVPLPAPVLLLGGTLPIWFLLARRRARHGADGALLAA